MLWEDFRKKENCEGAKNGRGGLTMAEIKVKPCPFCGKKVIVAKDNHDKILIECENCKLFFGIEVENGTELVEGWRAAFDSVAKATEAWNRRADI